MFSNTVFSGATGLSPRMRRELVNALNNGVASSTWASYRTAMNHLEKAGRDMGTVFTFPMSVDQLYVFIAWCREVRRLKGTSVSKIISALRMLHWTKGQTAVELRPPLVKMILKGWENRDEEMHRMEKRQPVTIETLTLIRQMLKKNTHGWTRLHRRMIWAVASVAFW